jgi:hypothetical protein
MVVVWDALTGVWFRRSVVPGHLLRPLLTGEPIKTIFAPHENGVLAMDMSPDAMFLVTLSNGLCDNHLGGFLESAI